MLLLFACAPEPTATDSEPLDLPEHSECLAEGEEMTAEICKAVVQEDGRQPTTSQDKTYGNAGASLSTDPELQWITSEIKRCTCSCCHTASWGGPGVYFWDLEFQPVWTDSASMWSLSVLSGETHEDFQTLPTDDLARVQAWVETERERRGLAGY